MMLSYQQATEIDRNSRRTKTKASPYRRALMKGEPLDTMYALLPIITSCLLDLNHISPRSCLGALLRGYKPYKHIYIESLLGWK